MILEKGRVCDTKRIYGNSRDLGANALLAAANELAVRGSKSGSFEVQIEIPQQMDKTWINSIRNHLKWAKELLETQGFSVNDIQVQGRIVPALLIPSVTVTGVGTGREEERMRPGLAIVQVGFAGLEGTLQILAEKEQMLKERFSQGFLRQMKKYQEMLCSISWIYAADAVGVSVMRQVSEGGILAALWDLAKETGRGLEVDFKAIALKQETIELCECFRLNPYQLASNGCILMITDQGDVLADTLVQKGVSAVVIGHLTDNQDKVIHNGEEVRYIDRPAPDEFFKIL